ncbi:MAG: TetR/AcrR family transcriptional regulator [Polyangiales bacterium]
MGTRGVDGEQSKREAILDAALSLFAERGFHGTAVPLVAERAKVGAGTVYRYFESKEALVNALYQHWKGEFSRALVGDFPEGMTARAQFAELWRRMWAFAKTHPEAAVFLELHHHQGYLDESSLALESSIQDTLVGLVEALQAQRSLKTCPASMLIAVAWGAFVGVVRSGLEGRYPLDDATRDQAEACVWEAIRS